MTKKGTNQNQSLIIGITIAIIATIAIVGIVIGILLANNNKGEDLDGADGADVINSTDSAQIAEDEQETDFSNVDVSVGFGDYDVMYAQAQAIQNGEMVGKIIRIDGIVSHPMSKYSIVEENENGSKIGTEFIIEGIDESEYPQDGDHVVITGEIIEKEPLYYVIKTSPRYVEMVTTAPEVNE